MVFWHQTVKYVLVVRRDDFGTAGLLGVIWRLATVLSCHIEQGGRHHWSQQVWACGAGIQPWRLQVAHSREARSRRDRTDGGRHERQQAVADSWEQVLPVKFLTLQGDTFASPRMGATTWTPKPTAVPLESFFTALWTGPIFISQRFVACQVARKPK